MVKSSDITMRSTLATVYVSNTLLVAFDVVIQQRNILKIQIIRFSHSSRSHPKLLVLFRKGHKRLTGITIRSQTKLLAATYHEKYSCTASFYVILMLILVMIHIVTVWKRFFFLIVCIRYDFRGLPKLVEMQHLLLLLAVIESLYQ